MIRAAVAVKPRLGRCKAAPGMKFGKWLVLAEAERKSTQRHWLCQCDCGKQRSVNEYTLTSGRSTQCMACASGAHGKVKSAEWESWQAMKSRCDNPAHHAYARYGGRGISYDSSWSDFLTFLADMGPRPIGTSLDRIDNEKGYSKENCRWATPKEQSRNLSTNRLVEYQGEMYSVSALAEKLGIKTSTMFRRVNKGLPLDAPVKGKA